MTAPNQWQAFYDRHAPHYDRGVFTHHTVDEVDFLLDVLALPVGARILDVGCGTGRHAIELAGRGTEGNAGVGIIKILGKFQAELPVVIEME